MELGMTKGNMMKWWKWQLGYRIEGWLRGMIRWAILFRSGDRFVAKADDGWPIMVFLNGKHIPFAMEALLPSKPGKQEEGWVHIYHNDGKNVTLDAPGKLPPSVFEERGLVSWNWA